MIVRTERELKEFWLKAKEEPMLVWDIESQGLLIYPKRNIETGEWEEHWIIGHAFLLPSDRSTYYLPVRMETCENLCNEEVLKVCANLFCSYERELCTFNGKFDLKFIQKEGVLFKGKLVDGMLAAHLWNENELPVKVNGKDSTFGLKAMGVKYFGVDADAESRELHEAAMNYIAGDLTILTAERCCLESEMTLMEREWKRELKSEYKDDLHNLRVLYNRFKKLEEKGEAELDLNLEPLQEAITLLRGKVEDINHRRIKDYAESFPLWLDKWERRNVVMSRTDRLKRVNPMEMLAKLPVELVAAYACQDVLLTFRLYSMIRFGKK